MLSVCARRAAAALLPGRRALRDAAPAGARAFPATAGRGLARPARPGARRPVFAGALAFVLLGFAALLAAPQTAHAVDKEIFSDTLTAAATSSSPAVFGWERADFGSLASGDDVADLRIPELGGGARYMRALTNDNAMPGTLKLGFTARGVSAVGPDPLDNSTFRARLTVDLDSASYDGSNSTVSPGSGAKTLTWTSGLTWADAQMIAVRLTLEVPGIDSIAFTSSPATGTTYDTGETVSATVTFDEAVDVTGTPQLTIDVGGTDKVLDYSSGTGTTALVFSGKVAFGDTDADGLSVAADKLDLNGGTIKATADANPAAVLTHSAVAASASHKVDGATAPPGPTVDSIAFNDAGTDGAFMTGDSVVASVTFSESVTVDTTGGTPQLTIKMGGADKVLNYATGTGFDTLHFAGYTVAANDEDTDGLSIEANKLDANGGTIQKTADTSVVAVLTHTAVAASANHRVDGVKPTLVTSGDDAPKTSVDGSKIILNFSENIGSVDTTKITVKVGTTDQTISSGSRSGTKVEITLTTALSATATNITVALAADAVADVPGNGIAAVSATSVTRTVPPGKPTLTLAAKDQSIDATVVFSAHGTSNITKYQYQIKSGSDAFGSWTDSTDNVSNTGGTFTIGGLTNGTEYTVQVRGVNSDGEGAASDAKAATPDAPPKITSAAITSDPGTDNTYIIGEDVVVTLTLDKAITLGTGSFAPHVEFAFGTNDQDADCVVGTGTPPTTLVCTETVVEGDEDTDGIDLSEGGVYETDQFILGPLGQRANLNISGLAADSDHKVDGIRPTLSRADADPNDLTKIILTFSEAIGTVTQADITVKKGTTDQTIDSVDIDSTDLKKVVVTLDTALLSTDTNVTVDLAADAVRDVPGNGIDVVTGTSVSVEDNVAPTFVSAGTSGTDKVVLTYDETLNTTQPATSAFTVKVGGTDRGVNTVAISGSDVTLTLASAFRPGDELTVAYTKPGTNPIKDAADNEAVSLAETAVTNNIPATAPEAPGSLAAGTVNISTAPVRPAADVFELSWVIPWHNGSPIEKHQYRYAEGSSVPASTTWVDIPTSAPGESNDTDFNVSGLDPDTEYTFEVRAVNGIDPGPEASVTRRTFAPAWSFTLRDSSNNNVTELTEGGDSATATVSITNNVRFSADQTVTIQWWGVDLGTSHVHGVGGATTLSILAGESSGSLEIHVPEGEDQQTITQGPNQYAPAQMRALTAVLDGSQIGQSIDLTAVDDEPAPRGSITEAPSGMTVDEGDSFDIKVELDRSSTTAFGVTMAITDPDGALSGTDTSRALVYAFGDTEQTATFTAVENTTQNDGARDVTFTLQLNPDAPVPYTLGTSKTVTITVRDDDTPPLAPRSFTAQAGNTEAILSWDAPLPSTPDHGQPVLRYEYRVKVGTGSFTNWAPIPGGDADTRSHTFTGLTNDELHTYELAAVNVADRGAAVQETVTPIEGVAVSFGAATLSVDEGDQATVTVTLATAPAAGTTVTVPIVATQGTGLNSSEYSGVPMDVVFNAGDTSKSFTVTAVQDTDDEPDRQLTFSFGTLPEGYVPGTNSQLVLTLVDDDVPIVSATFDAATAQVQEGTSRQVTVSLSQAPEREVVVPLVARRGANLAADEVSGVPENVTFAADETAQTFTVAIADDTVVEGNETLTLSFPATLPERVNAAGANPQLVLTVPSGSA